MLDQTIRALQRQIKLDGVGWCNSHIPGGRRENRIASTRASGHIAINDLPLTLHHNSAPCDQWPGVCSSSRSDAGQFNASSQLKHCARVRPETPYCHQILERLHHIDDKLYCQPHFCQRGPFLRFQPSNRGRCTDGVQWQCSSDISIELCCGLVHLGGESHMRFGRTDSCHARALSHYHARVFFL